MKTQTKIFLMLTVTMIPLSLYAQRETDIENSKDYPLVSRFEGAIIEYYNETKWESYPLPLSLTDNTFNWTNPLALEGKVIRIQYSVSPENNPAYILKNFEAAFKKAAFQVIMTESNPGELYRFEARYYGSDRGLYLGKFGFAYNPDTQGSKAFIAAKTNYGINDVYIAIFISAFSNTMLITQDIIEVEAAETGLVTAENISTGIQAKGHIAVYNIHFETGKSDIKSESEPSLAVISEYLNANPAKKFFIVGHTDNVGDFMTNMTLSENRAKAVVETLVSKYDVKVEQISAYGVSSLAPVASNSTDEGKKMNRRVEIVEQ